MKKKNVFNRTLILIIIAFYIILHFTPTLALRTFIFTMGYPVIAFTTGIVDDELHNTIDRQILESENAKCYTLTKPAFEKATQGELRNYKVTKRGFLYFAEYYGEM